MTGIGRRPAIGRPSRGATYSAAIDVGFGTQNFHEQ